MILPIQQNFLYTPLLLKFMFKITYHVILRSLKDTSFILNEQNAPLLFNNRIVKKIAQWKKHCV